MADHSLWVSLRMYGLLPVLFFVVVIFGSALVAVGLLKWRRYRLKKLKRSPLTTDLLRPPAQHLREQLEKVRDDMDGYVTLLMCLPMLVFAIHISQSYFDNAAETPLRIALSALMIIVSSSVVIFKMLKLHKRQDALRIGYDAELAVGQELDQLMRQGAAVFHDFPAENFNIDHIVISPVGVFAVETKGRAKPILPNGKTPKVEYDGKALRFPSWTDTASIAQAERQAKWLRGWLQRATGEPVAILPVIAIPGWFVDRKGRGDVHIYSGKELPALLSGSGFDKINDDKLQRIIHQVEQRCRNMQPTFNGTPKN